MNRVSKPILILGAGINGVALARELLLNRISVTLVDRQDIAAGTTAYSSRLIHGGLRYLEHGEISLVRESLAERERLLKLAPSFVQPLELWIPVKSQYVGMLSATAGFFHLPKFGFNARERGAWTIRAGLTTYDLLARSQQVRSHRRLPASQWKNQHFGDSFCEVYSYFDAQMEFPELFLSAMLQDAKRIADAHGVNFQIANYTQAKRLDKSFLLKTKNTEWELEPSAVVVASGPSGDETLASLGVSGQPLLGGTRGSHLITQHPQLVDRLSDKGIYAEAFDGRPVFILPWNDSVLIGTTDIRHEGNSDEVIATEEEIEYLIRCVNSVLPDIGLQREHLTQHYSGVRPLPYVPNGSTASIPRGHWLHRHRSTPWPCFTIVGGKLTTCRSLAQQSAQQIGEAIGFPIATNSRQRAFPPDAHSVETGRASSAKSLLAQLCKLPSTAADQELARVAVDQLYAQTIGDLVERRLMTVFDPELSVTHLRAMAEVLVEKQCLAAEAVDQTINDYVHYLSRRFGKSVIADNPHKAIDHA